MSPLLAYFISFNFTKEDFGLLPSSLILDTFWIDQICHSCCHFLLVLTILVLK